MILAPQCNHLCIWAHKLSIGVMTVQSLGELNFHSKTYYANSVNEFRYKKCPKTGSDGVELSGGQFTSKSEVNLPV